MSEKGFTLIEILIVLVIAALLAVSVMLRSGSQTTENAKTVSDRLRSIFIYAEQQAILQPATLGFDYVPKKYQFLRYDETGTWQPLTSDSILRPYFLPDSIQLIVSTRNNADEKHPAIIFYPSGEITAFKINVILKSNKKILYQITGESDGDITAVKIL